MVVPLAALVTVVAVPAIFHTTNVNLERKRKIYQSSLICIKGL